MKYAIYDKAADGYLTDMDFTTDIPNTELGLSCKYNEYITEAKLLDMKETAIDAVISIESFKFMEKGRFVIHSFDDTLKDQYIISEAGNPTKVVDNITVDLDGTVNVKYGTILTHWSTTSLEYAINRMNTLQEAVSEIYTPWNDTFMVYKVITIMDENDHTHYQFINRTITGLAKAEHDEEEKLLVAGKEVIDITYPLNKRIEELEKANRILTNEVKYHNECRMVLADIISAIKYAIYYGKDSDKRATYISYMTDKIKNDETFNRPELKTAKNNIPKICKHLTILTTNTTSKRIEELEKANYELGEQVAERGSVANHLLDENNILKSKVESIKKEARDWKKLYEKANKDREILTNVIDNIYDDLGSTDICKGLRETYDYIKGLSELNYINIHNDNTDNGEPIYITAAVEFKFIISKIVDAIESYEGEVQKYIDTNLSIWKKNWVDKVKENRELRAARDCTASVICAIRNAIYNNDSDALGCIENRMTFDTDFNSDPFMVGVGENIKDICSAVEINFELKELYKSQFSKALERAEFYKRQANSVYGMTVPTRCCGKQLMADILSGKKIPIDKKKYDNLVEYVANINLTYDTIFCMMDKPVYLSTITESLDELTK